MYLYKREPGKSFFGFPVHKQLSFGDFFKQKSIKLNSQHCVKIHKFKLQNNPGDQSEWIGNDFCSNIFS